MSKKDRDLTPEEERYRRAKARVDEIKGFYLHLISFVCVNSFLFILNLIASPGTLWFYWVLLPWGLGLLMHYLAVYGPFSDYMTKEWEERKIRELMAQEEKPKRQPANEDDELFREGVMASGQGNHASPNRMAASVIRCA